MPITQRETGKHGFTLVEMLLVVTIVAIMVSVAMPRFTRSFERMKLKSGAMDVAATVRYAQATSVLEERFLRFNVSADGAVCWVSEERTPLGIPPLREVRCELPAGVMIERIDFAGPLAGSREYVEFRPDGDTDPCAIRVAGRTGKAFEVLVARGAGNARITEATGTFN